MKRVKAACLEQTVQFTLKEDLPHSEAIQYVRAEYQNYLAQLERHRTKYKILEEVEQPDGSILIKLKKQYNSYDCTPYME